jgi:protein phosphatase 1 regulatory subunit 7
MSDVEDLAPAGDTTGNALDMKLVEEIIAADEVNIEISSMRIYSLTELFPAFEKLTSKTESIGVRKNLVHEIIPLPPNLRHIVELDLYDNKIKVISNLECLPNLRKLDLSYNQIKEVSGLSTLANLRELYLVENRIKHVQGLNALSNLRLLELGGNSIREISPDAFMGLASLEELFLGKNKIERIQGLEPLVSLKRLSFQANRLTSVGEGLRLNTALTELYLSENGISTIEGISTLASLTILDYSFNPIVSLGGVEAVPSLTEFWLTDGKVADWAELKRLQCHPKLTTVYLERNPIETSDKRYRNKVYHALPTLVQIDSWPIVNKQDPEADRRRDYTPKPGQATSEETD